MTAMASTPAARGPVALTLHGARFDLKALARNKRARFFAMAFPVLLLVVLSAVGGDSTVTQAGEKITFARFYVPGIVTMTLVLSCFATLTQAIVNRRAGGVWKRRRAAAVPSWALVLGQSLATMAMAVLSVAILLVVGRVAFGVGIGAEPLLAVVVTVILAAACLCPLAFAVASIIGSPDAAQPVMQLITFPLFFLSGIWFPVDGMPHGLKFAADLFPVAHISDAMHRAFALGATGFPVRAGDLAVLVLWAVGGSVVAARRFKWLPERA